MPEKIHEELKRIADFLHFLGQYERANRLIELAVALREAEVDDVEDLKEELRAASWANYD